MFLNQVRFISGGVGLLAIYCLDKKKTKDLKSRDQSFERPARLVAASKPQPLPQFNGIQAQPQLCSNQEGEFIDLDIKTVFPESLASPNPDQNPNPNDQDRHLKAAEALKIAVTKSRELCWSKIHESGTPGMVIGVSVNGKIVWKHGFGFSDIENRVLVNQGTVMRIASISKSITMTVVARLWDSGKLDLDKPVRHYVPSWPEKHPDITVRQLVSHMSGIRHYEKKKDPDSDETNNNVEGKKKKGTNSQSGSHDSEFKEFFLNEKYDSVAKSLELFKNDELLSKPGQEFHYTTHGFTLLSAVVESIVGESFEKHMKRTFKQLGLSNTYLDENEPIIPNRARYYMRNKDHVLINAPNVDNSYKWAGGGFLSNVSDLLCFGNALLYSYQYKEDRQTKTAKQTQPFDAKTVKPTSNDLNKSLTKVDHHPGPYAAVNRDAVRGKKPYLKPETMKTIWSPLVPMYKPESLHSEIFYGMGWTVVPQSSEFAFCKDQRYVVSHTGGAVGASSVLLILPPRTVNGHLENQTVLELPHGVESPLPEGVVVSIICNMNNVGLSQLALEVAKNFESVRFDQAYRVKKVYLC